MKISFLGPPGSFSHQAALQQFPGLDTACFSPQKSIKSCFESVSSHQSDYALVPLENSTNGQVVFTYDILRDSFNSSDRDFSVVGEQYVTIHHNLLGAAQDLQSITKIYSHPQVWSQCVGFLSRLEHVTKIDVLSTSRAAQLVAEDIAQGIRSTAAICSATASKLYHLDIILPNIEDDSANTTRFLVLKHKSLLESINLQNRENILPNRGDKKVAFLGLVSLDISSAFAVLAKHGVSILSVTCRPTHKAKWQYVHFIETWKTEGFDKCLEDLKSLGDLQTIGVFPRNSCYFDSTVNRAI